MGRRNFWIEGIGDDALFAFAAFFGTFIPILIMIFRRGNLIQRIHPENAANVEATREEVSQQRAQQSDQAQNGAGPQPDENQSGQQQQRPIRENHGQHDCPICLSTAEYAVQTNCGHIFCGLCITTYWHHGRWLGAVACPVCRQSVNILLINFTHEEHVDTAEERRTVVDAVYEYNRRFSGQPRAWQEYLRDLPVLLRHAIREFFSVGGLIWMFRVRVLICFLCALLYFVSPFDIIPEAVFGILGFLDDLFILLLLAIYISLIYRNVVQHRATNNANAQ